MNAIVTGANGFIGKHLVKVLLKKGFTVRCIDLLHTNKVKQVNYYTIDLTNKDAIINSKVLDEADYVFHLAGVTKRTSLDAFRYGNVIPTENLVSILSTQNRLKRFVFISSQAAAGPAHSFIEPVTEEMTPRPIEAYGMSKLEAEYFIRFQCNLPFTIIRPCSVYGPGDVDFLPIFQQIRYHLSLYANNKNSFVSTIYVDDLVNGIFNAALSTSTLNKVYFLGANEPTKWQDIYNIIAQIQAKKVLEINIPSGMLAIAGRAGEIYAKISGKHFLINRQKIALSKPRYWICSSQAAQRDFGFTTRYSLFEGLLQTYQSLSGYNNLQSKAGV